MIKKMKLNNNKTLDLILLNNSNNNKIPFFHGNKTFNNTLLKNQTQNMISVNSIWFALTVTKIF